MIPTDWKYDWNRVLLIHRTICKVSMPDPDAVSYLENHPRSH